MRLMNSSRIWLQAIILLCGASMISNAPADWKRIGFAGKEIGAITSGLDKSNGSRRVVVFGVKDSAVFSIAGSQDSIFKFPRFAYDESDKPAGTIHSLFMDTNGVTAFAGTDSGLYGESLYFESLPAWKKINAIPSVAVVGITRKDSIYCIATAMELYRTKSPFGVCIPCSVSKWLPSPARSPNFTSITSWGLGGFAAGSNAAARSGAFGGVITGGGNDNKWINWTCMNNHCVDSNVYSLTFSDFGTLFAGTSRGVYGYSTAEEMGVWYEITPQLTISQVHHVWETYDSIIKAREIYASTDSGVYILSPRINSNQWTRSLKVKAYGVASLTPRNSNAVYAATADGVWKFEPTTGSGVGMVDKSPFSRTTIIGVYSIDGKKISAVSAVAQLKRMSGVFIALQQTGKCKKLLVFTERKTRSFF